jgi:hypothetical protein
MEETTTDASFGSRSGVASETGPTNPIEPCLTTVQRVARSVKRRRAANQPLGWTGTELWRRGKSSTRSQKSVDGRATETASPNGNRLTQNRVCVDRPARSWKQFGGSALPTSREERPCYRGWRTRRERILSIPPRSRRQASKVAFALA